MSRSQTAAAVNSISRTAVRSIKPRMNFAEEFKKARQRHGLSQSEAALQWKIPIRALRNWEQGLRAPNGPTLFQLLPVLFPQIADVWLNTFGLEQPKLRGENSRRPKRNTRSSTRS